MHDNVGLHGTVYLIVSLSVYTSLSRVFGSMWQFDEHIDTSNPVTVIKFITRHSLVERRARYLFYCMFVCLFGQRFLSNPRADSRQILHGLGRDVSSPILGFSDPVGGQKVEK